MCPKCGSRQWLIKDEDREYHNCMYCGPVLKPSVRTLPYLMNPPKVGRSREGMEAAK